MTQEEIEKMADDEGRRMDSLNFKLGFIRGASAMQPEIDELRKENKEIKKRFYSSNKRIAELEKENEELKKEKNGTQAQERISKT